MTAVEDRTNGPTRPSPHGDAPSPETEIGALLGELSEETRLLVRQEMNLARAELKESTQHATGVGAGFGVAALIGYLALAVLSIAAALGLAEALDPWLAFLIVGLALGALALAGYIVGRKSLQALNPVPRKTIDTLKEDFTWLRNRIN